jgi:hypothetical protein
VSRRRLYTHEELGTPDDTNELLPVELIAQVHTSTQVTGDVGDSARLFVPAAGERQPMPVGRELLGKLSPLCGRPRSQRRARPYVNDHIRARLQARLAEHRFRPPSGVLGYWRQLVS